MEELNGFKEIQDEDMFYLFQDKFIQFIPLRMVMKTRVPLGLWDNSCTL
jgi:hypothetical protein